MVIAKNRAPRNRTIELDDVDVSRFSRHLMSVQRTVSISEISNQVINQDTFDTLHHFPSSFADLLFIDPPYNLTKRFNSNHFSRKTDDDYAQWFGSWFPKVLRILKPTGSLYVCADWRTSAVIYSIVAKHVKIRNRITWEREKGRGAKNNWKNSSEDIIFGTMSDNYTFNTDSVKLKKRVLAPYTDANGQPKDWQPEKDGNFRLTHPSNLWTDITVPFWSMPENTDHPTQKPEKLLAKILLASTQRNDIIFDPFLGSGTSAVVAKKLGRRFVGIEIDKLYCCLALKRLELAELADSIQGYSDGVFWERNTAIDVAGDRSLKHPISADEQTNFFAL